MFFVQNYNPLLGILLILVGGGLLVMAAGELLLRVVLALCAMALINHGLQLCGKSPRTYIYSSWTSRYRGF